MAVVNKALADALLIGTDALTPSEKGDYTIADGDVIKALQEKFVSRETAPEDKELLKHFRGKILGSLDAKVKRWANLQPADIPKDADTEELIQLALKKQKDESEKFLKGTTEEKIKQAEGRVVQL